MSSKKDKSITSITMDVKLTEIEILEIKDSIVDLSANKEKLLREKAVVVSNYSRKLKEIELAISRQLMVLEEPFVSKVIECYCQLSDDGSIVEYYSSETGELLKKENVEDVDVARLFQKKLM